MTSRDVSITPNRWTRLFGNRASNNADSTSDSIGPAKWTMGILNDRETVEVPGSVLLLAEDRNEPLGLRNIHARTSHSSIPAGFAVEPQTPRPAVASKKRTDDGTIILDPQPDDSANDPLNWPSWRRDAALLSLGFYCMIGGGITPLIAAGFTDVAEEFDVSVEKVALTTGLCMTGLGIGAVIASPTAILYGKRPIYLAGAIIFIGTALWSGLSPSFESLLVARVFQGISISPVECLPSATIAEIFFLHERAYRIGIYTLLLLGGKNLIPLAGAAIIGKLGWRWAFFIMAMVVAFAFCLLFLFVPETFWDRTPSRKPSHKPSLLRRMSSRRGEQLLSAMAEGNKSDEKALIRSTNENHKHVGFSADPEDQDKISSEGAAPSPTENEKNGEPSGSAKQPDPETASPTYPVPSNYTQDLRQKPAQSFVQHMKVFNGRLNNDNWFKVMIRPFILLVYPAVLWSAIMYSCSIGWLIVLAETMAMIYRDPHRYNFTAIQTGLVYLAPFIGAVLGTGVAGKISDILVRSMARRNGGLYEPEFRLIMALPILITTCMGLIGFGWSAEVHDEWIVPTIFFGIISFGCSLGSTTSITFCVDSYRQYAGEALVTLNFTKNIAHGLVFSLFVSHWLEKDGSKRVFMWIGVIQLIVCLFSIPMYIFGKRARMWTARKNLMEKW
ncbi:MFS transporter [Fusarium oxysporum f. sp. phaseoli]